MADIPVPEIRVIELGAAERQLVWARAAVQDYISGRPGPDVFEEIIILLTSDEYSASPLDPDPLSAREVIAGRFRPTSH